MFRPGLKGVNRRRTLTVLLVLAVAGAAAATWKWNLQGFWSPQGAVAQAPAQPRSVPIEAGQAEKKVVPYQVDALGTVTPMASVAIKSRLDNEITGVHFGDGARPNLLFKRSARERSPRLRRPGKFWSSISSAPGVHLVSPSCQKSCGSGRAYKTGARSNLLSWARTPVATHQNAYAPSAGGNTLPFPSLSIREKKRTPHLV